ncbi:MAG: glycosyltransferase [Oscillospiraceae bacterium]|nr:glycosyltransferase [Oscillospiraceae bacterium]
MDIIYLGLLFCEKSLQEEFGTIKRKISMAPHKFQSNLIRGMESLDNVNLSVVNVPPTGSFPINNKKFISREYIWGKENKQIGYVNLPWIKHIIQGYKLYSEIEKRISNEKTTWIVIYSLYEPFLKTVQRIKKRHPEIHVCLLHTDAVPGRDDMEQYMTKAAKRRGDRVVKIAKSFDRFILLTENLLGPLEVGNRPSLIVECLCDETQQQAETKESVEGTFLYTGEVCRAFGICELAEAFKEKESLQLWICGDGDAHDDITKLASNYPNIQYFGYVTQEKIKKLQDKCSFLINPRQPAGTYTKYSFPSKTAEYMMTGKPVIMYKLEAIPDGYDKYLNYLKETTPKGIAEEIQLIADSDYSVLKEKAENGREYMLKNKNSKKIGQRIVNFLCEE